MRAIWEISANGRPVSEAFNRGLSALEITDHAGFESDALSLTINNPGGIISAPETGAELDVSIGIAGEGLTKMGRYRVTGVTISGPARMIEIRAEAMDMRIGAKSVRTQEWRAVTLGDIARAIAARNELTARVAADIAAIRYDHITQNGESDLHFLTRLSMEIGAVAKIADRNLVLAWRGRGETVSGERLPEIGLYGLDFSSWSMSDGDREKYLSCHAWWQDVKGAKKRKVTAGDGEPAHEIRRPWPNEAAAQRAAAAELARLQRSARVLSGTLYRLRPDIAAEQIIIPEDLDPAAERKWITTSVRHRIDGEAITEFEAEEL